MGVAQLWVEEKVVPNTNSNPNNTIRLTSLAETGGAV